MSRKIDKTKAIQAASYFILVIISVLLLFIGNKIASDGLLAFDDEYNQEVVEAVALEILDKNVSTYGQYSSPGNTEITFNAKILDGKYKDLIVTAHQNIDPNLPFDGTTEVKAGDKILLTTTGMAEQNWQFMEFIRTDKLLLFGILFIIVLLIFGRKKGFNTLLALLFTCSAIFFVFIPSILSGKNIYLSSILICLYAVVMTLLIVNGLNKKTVAAIIGCLGGIFLSGLLTVIMGNILALTGIVDEESIYLTNMPLDNPIDLKAIIFAAIIIGAMGAIMDVAMSISSSLQEVKDTAEDITFEELFRSGMNIGRDVMATMANTLILAYIGSSLSVVLLLSVYSTSLLGLLNREMIVVEILQAIIGSFGILLTMPLTSLICAALYTRPSKTVPPSRSV